MTSTIEHRLQRSASFGISRRQLLQTALAGLWGVGTCSWFPRLAQAAGTGDAQRHCILLWMTGGPSQLDTFDLKPGHDNGGEFQEISTNVPGVRFSEHLPLLARQAQHLAIIRGLSTTEGDHGRGTHLMHTGFAPGVAGIRYPTLGSLLSKELTPGETELPGFVSVAPFRLFNAAAHSPGFLGPAFAPLAVTGESPVTPTLSAQDIFNGNPSAGNRFATLGIENLRPAQPLSEKRAKARVEFLRSFESEFAQNHADAAATAHQTVYEHAIRLMNSNAGQAFDLSQEPDEVRARYGSGIFGQGCLLARRLVEHGVPFVEVSLGGPETGGVGWDTHTDNFAGVLALSQQLDAGFATLLSELDERGLLERTTIVWMGEFGRTPQINGQAGRDHFTNAWSCLLAGGGIRGGQVFGKTSDDGMEVLAEQVRVGDVLATICEAVGVPPDQLNTSNVGRPIPIAEGTPIASLLRTS